MASNIVREEASGRARSWLSGQGNENYGVDVYGDYYESRQRVDTVKAVQPLVDHLRAYEEVRSRLLKKGGRVRDLQQLTAMLQEPISLGSRYGSEAASLANRRELNLALWDVAWGEVRLDVRQLEEGWPVYYLCRTQTDYSWNSGLIVEDLYRTPDYALVDERFVTLMVHGREEEYLRLSLFREQVERSGLLGKKPSREEVDDGLLLVGQHVLQPTWHDDQRVGMLVSATLGIPLLGQAIELLYLCLSGELCELRGKVDDFALGFFRKIMPHPPIEQLLVALGSMSGESLNRLPQLALRRYTELSRAFNAFLSVPVDWRDTEAKLPLYKLVFANIDRFGAIAAGIAQQKGLVEAAGQLSRVAAQVIESLLHATTDPNAT